MISSLALDSSWRDYWGQWNSQNEPLAAPLEQSLCHAPRYALIPAVELQVIPAGGKIGYNFRLVPGSLIWGFWIVDSAREDTDYVVQITDVNLGHKLFQEPTTGFELQTQGGELARFPSFTMLPTPHPVVGEGLFTLEAWGTPGNRFYMVLGVAEVTDCQVR